MDTTVLIMIAIIHGAIGSAIGSLKRRSLAGLLFGFLLGPIGWLLILVGPDRRPKCRRCKRVLNLPTAKCGHCGMPISGTKRS